MPVKQRKISKNGIALLMLWEGFELLPYKDTAFFWTIGVGHLLSKTELNSKKIFIKDRFVSYEKGLTKDQVIDLLLQDLDKFMSCVARFVKVSLNTNQFDALVIFAFNIGISAFEKSTLLKVLNCGDYEGVPMQMSRWTKAGGKQSKGLVNRRNNEIKLWNTKAQPENTAKKGV